MDVHEIKQKQYNSQYSFILSNRVNTETAEYKSLPFKLYLYIKNDLIKCDFIDVNKTADYVCKFSILLPIHARYRQPTEQLNNTGNYFNFTLYRPKLFTRNLNDFETNDLNYLNDSLLNSSILKFPCQKMNIDYLHEIKFLQNNANNFTICDWTSLESESVRFLNNFNF